MGEPYAVQSAMNPSEQPRKRKGWRTCLVVALVLVVVLCGGAFLAFSLLSKPKDLGVTFSEADYFSAMNKAGISVEPPPAGEDWADSEFVYSGSQPLDATFTNAELSALFSYSHAPDWPISDAQVRIGSGTFESSGRVRYAGMTYAFYAQAQGGISGKAIDGSITGAEVDGITVPSQYYEAGTEYVLDLLNTRLARQDAFDIRTAEFTEEGLHLVGTVPETAERLSRNR